jgi:hypothetical protein
MWIYYVNVYMSDEWSEISHIFPSPDVYIQFFLAPFISLSGHKHWLCVFAPNFVPLNLMCVANFSAKLIRWEWRRKLFFPIQTLFNSRITRSWIPHEFAYSIFSNPDKFFHSKKFSIRLFRKKSNWSLFAIYFWMKKSLVDNCVRQK